MVCVSVEDDRIPVTEQYVRGHVYMTAFNAAPSEKDEKVSNCRYIIQTAVKGSLPNWIVNKGVASEIGDAFDKILKYHSQ
jgi:hypothetical protein